MMNISDLHEAFCDEALIIRNFSPTTVKLYRDSFIFFKKLSGIEKLEDITTDKLREFFIHGRTKRAWSAERHLSLYKALKSFLKWCEKNEYIAKNPILKLDKPKLGKHLPKRISQEDAELLLETILSIKYFYRFEKFRNYAFFSLLLHSGLRAQEALNLGFNDINLTENAIFVKSGKGNKDRVVPINEKLKVALKSYLNERERLKRESPYFFTSLWGNKQFTYSGLKKIVAKLRKASGVDFSAHRLRHTFATLMLWGGCDLQSLSEMMGHASITTTAIYLSSSIAQKKKEMNKHPLNNSYKQSAY